MAQLQTLKDRESGQTVYPITSTEAVFDENGVSLKNLLLNQKQSIENTLKDYPKKTDVTQPLEGKQDKLSPTTDIYITNDNIIGLSAEFKKSKLDKSDWDAQNDKFTIRGKYIYPTNGSIYSDSSYAITEFIPINRNYDIVVVAQATDNTSALALYDESHQFLGGCSKSRDSIGNVERNIETNTYTLHATDIPVRAAYFRCGTNINLGSRTYSNGPTEESRTGAISNAIADSKFALFIDLYNAAFKVGVNVYGKYDPENAPDPQHPFYGNKLWMTYEEALEVLIAGRPYNNNDTAKFYSGKPIRTNLPFLISPLSGFGEFAFVNDTVEVFRLSAGDNNITGPYAFYRCAKLHTIIGRIKTEMAYTFGICPKLANVEVIIKTGITLHLDGCPLLSLESFRYMIDNSESCSLIVHPNTYAKLTGDTTNEAAAALTPEELAQWQQVLTDAVAKNISFATV